MVAILIVLIFLASIPVANLVSGDNKAGAAPLITSSFVAGLGLLLCLLQPMMNETGGWTLVKEKSNTYTLETTSGDATVPSYLGQANSDGEDMYVYKATRGDEYSVSDMVPQKGSTLVSDLESGEEPTVEDRVYAKKNWWFFPIPIYKHSYTFHVPESSIPKGVTA
jgi:hypothetical protein